MAQDPQTDPVEILTAIAPERVMNGKTYVAGRIVQSFMFFCDPVAAEGQRPVPERLADATAHVHGRIPPSHYGFWNAFEPHEATRTAARTPPPDPAALLAAYRAQEDPMEFCHALWTGDARGTAPAVHLLSFFHQGLHEGPDFANMADASDFQLNLPLTWLAAQEEPGLVQALFRDLCTILQPRSAYAGLAMATPLRLSILQDGGAAVLKPLLDRHPGLMVGQASAMRGQMRAFMSAPNWLTALDAGLLERCGGEEVVLTQLDMAGIQTRPMPAGGLMIQAGPSPQLGHLDEGITLPHYGAVARALKPARLDVRRQLPADRNLYPLHVPDYGSEDAPYDPDLLAAEQNAWLGRFDDH